MSAYISGVETGSYAQKHGIRAGSTLLKINGHEITDVLDYRFYMTDTVLRVTYKTPEGRFCIAKVKKADEYEDLGLIFDTYLMDKQRSCKNKCIFCFIDQLPLGMRESLYFKDDDSRLSFFYGNYITLTNLTSQDVDRIISMHISPVNVSVHTMNPELRVQMMSNKTAGESLNHLRRLAKAGISINTQLVLCPDVNDGDELRYSLSELAKLAPGVQSIACVPVGLTDHRDGLYPLKMYTKETARATIEIIERAAEKFLKKLGTRLCYAADEFYLKAELPIPDEDYYEGYPQLDNGVGLCRLLESEALDAIEELSKAAENGELKASDRAVTVSIATGRAAYPLIKRLACKVEKLYNGLIVCGESEIDSVAVGKSAQKKADAQEKADAKKAAETQEEASTQKTAMLRVKVHCIENEFFGRNITVSGLITGRDLVSQLREKTLGDALLISESMVRTTYPQDDSKDNVLLDDMTTDELSEILGTPIYTVANDGREFVERILEVGKCQDL